MQVKLNDEPFVQEESTVEPHLESFEVETETQEDNNIGDT